MSFISAGVFYCGFFLIVKYYLFCKGTAYSSLDNLVQVSIIQLALGSSESTINSSLPFCSCCHGTYYIALLGSVVISVLICVPIVTGTQTRLVQYKQLVMYGRIPYLNISLISWTIYRSNLRRLLYYSRACSGTPPSAPLYILQSSTVHHPEYNSIYNSTPPFSTISSLTKSSNSFLFIIYSLSFYYL